MDALLLIVLAGVGLAALLRYSAKWDSIPRQWQAVMLELGFKFRRVEARQRLWQGRFEGQLVHAALGLELQGGSGAITLSSGSNLSIPRSLEVYSDSTLNTFGRLVDSEQRDLVLGDPAFDEQAVLPQLDAHSCAALSHGTRESLLRLLRRGGWVRQGQVVLSGSWSAEDNQATLAQQLRWVCRLAALLSVPHESLHQRLAHNALRDPAPGVRLTNLRFLSARETRAPRPLLLDTARQLLSDVSPPVRLLAALQLGPEGLPALRALLGASGAPEPICATLAALQPEHAQPLLPNVLACTSSPHESVRVEAARLLGRSALPEAEASLTALLADTSPHVQLAASQALATAGTVAAVEHLLPLAQALLDSQLRQAARAAVGRIQSRLGNAEAGLLSLAEPQSLAGALTLPDSSAAEQLGALSLGEGQDEPAASQAERAPRVATPSSGQE